MNLFNRIALVVVCVALLVAAVAIIVLTWTIPNRSINWLHDAVDWIDANDGDLEKALLTTISATVALFSTIVLLIELVPRSGPDVKVTDLSRGDATLSTAAIGQRIEEAVCQVPNVTEVRANVRAKKRGVLVSLDLQVDPEANLATVTDDACQMAQEVLTDRVHVALLRPPTARLHYRELRLHGRGNNNTRRLVRTGAPPALAADAPAPTFVAPVSPPPEPPALPASLSRESIAVQPPAAPPEPAVDAVTGHEAIASAGDPVESAGDAVESSSDAVEGEVAGDDAAAGVESGDGARQEETAT